MMPSRPSSLLRASAVLLLALPVTATGQASARGATSDSAAGVPRGMMPPAGKCRVWMAGVPATRQPAPTDCATALRKKPANARVIHGPNASEPRQAGLEAAREKRSLLTPIGERRPALVQEGSPASVVAPRSAPPPRRATPAEARVPPSARQPAASAARPGPSPTAPTTPPPPPPKKPERP